MNGQNKNSKKAIDLEKEQSDLISLMETSMHPELLDAVQQAYKTSDDTDIQTLIDISYEGTQHA
jgi:hypothetical protein